MAPMRQIAMKAYKPHAHDSKCLESVCPLHLDRKNLNATIRMHRPFWDAGATISEGILFAQTQRGRVLEDQAEVNLQAWALASLSLPTGPARSRSG